MKLLVDDKNKEFEKNRKQKEKTNQRKPLSELKSGLSEEEFQQKQQFFQFLKEKIGTDKLSAKLYKLSNDYISQYGFTYLGMYQALWFFSEIQEKELTGDIVGIIPYIYDEAQVYFSLSQKTEKNNTDINKVETLYKKKVIQISPQRPVRDFINIETILEAGK